MRIDLQTCTEKPLHAIAAAALSIGRGQGARDVRDISDEDAVAAFKDACKGALSSVLEFATFNFFWQDVPIFLLRELYRSRFVSPAEQSLRFTALDVDIVDRFDMRYAPSVGENVGAYHELLKMQVMQYKLLLEQGVSVQDARNVLGVWVPTHTTTIISYRALRDILSVRQTSQAHPAWQDAVAQIKALVGAVHSVLAEELRDICDISGRCVWQSKLDRPCSACEARGRVANHVHDYVLMGDGWAYCECGERKPILGYKEPS